MIWDNFAIFRTNCAIVTTYTCVCADLRTFRGFSRECGHDAWSNGGAGDFLADFSQRRQEMRTRAQKDKRTKKTLKTICLWGGVLLCPVSSTPRRSQENSLFNLWVSQSMLDHNQNLFLIVSYCFCSFGEFIKVSEKKVCHLVPGQSLSTAFLCCSPNDKERQWSESLGARLESLQSAARSPSVNKTNELRVKASKETVVLRRCG